MNKIVLILLALSAFLIAGESDGVTGMAFLKVGVGAQAGGMGEAFTAVTGDATATYWNPAGLMNTRKNNLVMMYNNWIASVKSQFGAVQFSGKKSSWGVHIYSTSVDDIPVRDIPTTEPLEFTGANYLSLGVSYARRLSSRMDGGVTVKYLFEKLFVYSAGGYAVDLGARYRLSGRKVVLGASLQHIGTMSKLNQAATKLPALARVGIAYHMPDLSPSLGVTLAADLVKPLDESLRIHFGLESSVLNQIKLRAGYMNGYENRSVTLGIGIKKSAFGIDYSYVPFENDLGDSQRFSIWLRI
jgi:hypothetical protein